MVRVDFDARMQTILARREASTRRLRTHRARGTHSSVRPNPHAPRILEKPSSTDAQRAPPVDT
jgi:hypothetical protein